MAVPPSTSLGNFSPLGPHAVKEGSSSQLGQCNIQERKWPLSLSPGKKEEEQQPRRHLSKKQIGLTRVHAAAAEEVESPLRKREGKILFFSVVEVDLHVWRALTQRSIPQCQRGFNLRFGRKKLGFFAWNAFPSIFERML